MTNRRIVILGAAGRDFHNFNVAYRDDPTVEVVAFTATQIPGISDRVYPRSLAGDRYPNGIPIAAEEDLERICADHDVDEVVFAYSDVSHATVMQLASRALACGADFTLLGPDRTMLPCSVPVVAVSAVRTGCGKSQIARWLGRHAREQGHRVAVLRHPMPYGDLAAQRVQRFAAKSDLDAAECTAEEREEYEPHLAAGNVVYAGVDYAEIAARAASEADLLVWDGGNNDFPFLRPDLHLVLVDALRPDQVAGYHPGETNLRLADVIVVNKVDAASNAAVQQAIDAATEINSRATIVRAASPATADDPERLVGRRVLVVEDGPTITHGGMAYGAGYVAATAAAAIIVDPRQSASGPIREVFDRYPHIGRVVPALGYGRPQLEALRDCINGSDADLVVAATPIDLAALIELDKPVVRVRYGFAEAGVPTLESVVDEFLDRHPAPHPSSPATP